LVFYNFNVSTVTFKKTITKYKRISLRFHFFKVCQSKGGYLAVIDTQNKQKIIQNLIKQHFAKFSPGKASYLFGIKASKFNLFGIKATKLILFGIIF
jgi:hypothetical protein